MSELKETFISRLIHYGIPPDEAEKINFAQAKNSLLKAGNGEFIFHSKSGCPDRISSANITIYDLLAEKKQKSDSLSSSSNFKINVDNEFTILHRAADVIKKELKKNSCHRGILEPIRAKP